MRDAKETQQSLCKKTNEEPINLANTAIGFIVVHTITAIAKYVLRHSKYMRLLDICLRDTLTTEEKRYAFCGLFAIYLLEVGILIGIFSYSQSGVNC